MNFFPLFVLFSVSHAFRLQGAAVKGQLLCNGKAWRNAKIKLYDIDTSEIDDLVEKNKRITFSDPGDADDLLDEKYSDKDGEFQLDGTTRELTDIDPVLYIYHDCEDGIRPCQKMLTITIPKRFIHHGKVKEFFDIGIMNLEQNYPDEDRSCNH